MENLTKWEKLMVSYGAVHQNKVNLLTHYIGVPIILASFFVPFTWLSLEEGSGALISLNAALIVAAIFGAFYLSLDRKLGMLSIPFLLLCLVAANWIGAMGMKTGGMIAAIGFVGGYVFQFIGHGIEGKKPALLTMNPLFAAVTAPLFVVAEYVRPLGVHRELWKKVETIIQHNEKAELA